MRTSNEFEKRIKRIQAKIMSKKGRYESHTKITDKMVKLPDWEKIEEELLNEEDGGFDIKLKMDRRKK